jgi:hypothetical protein
MTLVLNNAAILAESPADRTATPSRKERITTGILLMGSPALFLAAFTLLAGRFDYPDILRQPAGEVLLRFHREQSGLIPLWWMMFEAAILFLIVSILAVRLVKMPPAAATLTVVMGAFAGLVQIFGLSRWIFLVPLLAERYAVPNTADAERAAAKMVFEAFHQWAGAGVGEFLGYLFTGLWTWFVAAAMLRQGQRWRGGIGIASAVGILLGVLETIPLPFAGMVNAAGYTLWSFWMIAWGFSVLVSAVRMSRSESNNTISLAKETSMKTLLSVLAVIAIYALPAQAQAPLQPQERTSPVRRLYVHGFRSPAIGAEYRVGRTGVYGGLYTTILGNDDSGEKNSTEFLKFGATYYFTGRKRLESFASIAYLRGLNNGWQGRNALFVDSGFRYNFGGNWEARLGTGYLATSFKNIRVNPTVGISYSIRLK